ncbi:MAG: SH3 domain-containing protein [Oscillospiraceae bacterium]|nr:SH3 domain-containing protein [Oscillospiraceae bacterium]
MKHLGKTILVLSLTLCAAAALSLTVIDSDGEPSAPSFAVSSVKAVRSGVAPALLPLPADDVDPSAAEVPDQAAAPEAADEEAPAEEVAQAQPQAAEPPAQTVTLPVSSSAVTAVGIADGDVNLRSGAGTGYGVLTTVSSGTAVAVTGGSGKWLQVRYDGKSGYMSADYVTVRTSADDLHSYGWVDADGLNVRSGASISADKVFTLSRGVYVEVTGFSGGWYAVKADGGSGWVSGDYLALCAALPVKTETPAAEAPANEPAPAAGTLAAPPPAGNSASDIVTYARTFLGTPYVYGGASPYGFDCSGFTMYVYAHFGVSLAHGSNDQYKRGTALSYSQLQPGDLVFFYNAANGVPPTTHVGIYVGGGSFIHASSYYGGVVITDMSSGPYYRDFVAGRRIG